MTADQRVGDAFNEWGNGAALRERFTEFADLLTYAMSKPEVQAIPEVADVLHLLGEGLLVLARSTVEFMEAEEARRG